MQPPPQPQLATKPPQQSLVRAGPKHVKYTPPAPKTIDEMVAQNQRVIAQKSQRGKGANSSANRQSVLPQMSPIDPNQYRGQEKDIVAKYLDADLMNKDAFESKNARFALGIGMPEARAIHKRTDGKYKTFRD